MDPATSFLTVNDHPARTKRIAPGVVGNAHPTQFIIPVWLPRAVGVFLAGWLALSGVLLLVRSSLDATQRLGLGTLLLAAVAIMGAAALSRAALGRPTRDSGGVLPALWLRVIVSLGVVFWGFALTSSASSTMAAALGWLPLVAEETWAWHRRLRYFPGARFSHATEVRAASDDRIIQQFTRTLTADGAEVIRGSLAVLIARGSRMGAGHIAFCPPFSERPQFDAHFAETQNATLKVTQLYAHGARIEVRLPQAAQANTALSVCFTATTASR